MLDDLELDLELNQALEVRADAKTKADAKAKAKADAKAKAKARGKNKLLGQGSYGCVYYPGISCSGKIIKKKTVTKLQEISFYSVNEINIGKYIKKHIHKYSSMYAPIVKYCVVSFQTIQKSDLNIFDCKTLFPDDTNSNSTYYDNDYEYNYNDYKDYIKTPAGGYEIKSGANDSANFKSKLHTKYYLMYMNYIVNKTFKKYFEAYIQYNDYVVDLIKASLYVIKSVGHLVSANIIHNDLHVNNILVNLKNNKPIIIDFGLSMYYTKCFKYQNKTIDFEYLKYLLFDFREDQYHIILEKRFISFITNNKSNQYSITIATNFVKNELTQSIIDLFINDAYDSISKQYVIPFNKVELAEYYKSLKQFYYQFLNKNKYPNYSVIISYLLKFLFKYTDLYSIVFDIYYINKSTSFVKDDIRRGRGKGEEGEREGREEKGEERERERYYERDIVAVKVGRDMIYKEEKAGEEEADSKEEKEKEDYKEENSVKYSGSKPLFDFFMVLLKKNLHPQPSMRLHSSELTKISNYIIETIKKSESVIEHNIFIKDFGEFLVSQSINPKIIFTKKFAYLDFSTILNNDVFVYVKKHF
jgi:serine/threonine protein kinase